MATAALTERYAANLHGVLSCFDRVIITGTLPGACYAEGMTSFLYARKIKIFDYPRFAEPLRERIRERAQDVCAAAGIEIEHVSKSHIRKEDLVARVLAKRGDAPGLVHVLSTMEALVQEHGKVDNFASFLRVCCGRYLALQLSGGIPQDASIPIGSLNAQRVLATERSGSAVPFVPYTLAPGVDAQRRVA
jgi:predicted DNA-binding ribbon-helix-helix protein